MKGLRWLSVVAPVVAVAIIEIVSDGLLDSLFPFPLDTIVVVVLVGVLAWVFSTLAFRRIDRLSDELRARNTDLERREASAAALHRVSVAIAAMDDLGEILGTIVGQARDLLSVDVALLLTHRRRRRGPRRRRQRAARRRSTRPAASRVSGSPGSSGPDLVGRAARGAAPARRRDHRAA